MKLKHVQVIFRHGARTPISWSKERFQDFSNMKQQVWDQAKLCIDLPAVDINYNVKLHDGSCPSGPRHDENCADEMEGGCSTGQLTLVGQQQLFDLGKSLSKQYIVNKGLLSPSYQRNEVYVRSSYFQRTVQSAVCLLAGLYEKGTITEHVHIETKEIFKEDIFPNLSGCSNLINWCDYVFSPEIRPSEEQEVENYLNGLMGKEENKTNAHFGQISDLIRCQRAHGLSVPEFLLENEDVISKLQTKIVEKFYGKGNVNVIRNCIGSFLETVCCRINEGIEGSSSHQMFLYSAHDSTIYSVLNAFGVDINEWPPFASHLIIELYKREDNESFIRVLYNGKPIIFACDSGEDFVPAEKFLSLLQVYRVVDFDENCGNMC